jgi:hypothetical protein
MVIKFKSKKMATKKANDKKAWIRIAESAIAIMLLASVILVLIAQQAKPKDIADTMYRLQHTILDEASKDDSVRAAVLTGNTSLVESFIKERLPAGFGFNISICAPAEECEAEVPDKDIYVDDILISSTLQQYQPRKLKFYIWIT